MFNMEKEENMYATLAYIGITLICPNRQVTQAHLPLFSSEQMQRLTAVSNNTIKFPCRVFCQHI